MALSSSGSSFGEQPAPAATPQAQKAAAEQADAAPSLAPLETQSPESSRTFPGLGLEATAFNRKQLRHPEAPQAALAGRSNVGKSSLVNALAGRKALAKISATPGKTRSVNYYRISGTESFLVDLPGYGYARCSQAERNNWAELLQYYFENTPGLRTVILLLDARLSPQKADKELMAYAAGLSLPVLAVLTKADKCSKKELGATVRAWEALAGKESVLVTSSRSRAGVPELGRRILELLW